MKHISEFDYTVQFPKVMYGEILKNPEEYKAYLIKNGYAYEVRPVEKVEEKIIPKKTKGK